MWYKREEAQRRFSIFFGSATLAAAFGSLLASAIQNMNGIGGYSGWRWIFIIEGLATCVVSVLAFYLIPDFPEDCKWLTRDEAAYMHARLLAETHEVDGGVAPPASTAAGLLQFFKTPKNFLGGLMYFGLTIPAYGKPSPAWPSPASSSPKTTRLTPHPGLAYFTPTIVQTYGYSQIRTQLLSVPPNAAAWILSILLAIESDCRGRRAPFVGWALALAITGAGILLNVHDNTALEYASVCLIAMGTYSAMPLVICWYTMNLRGGWMRGVGTGWMIGFGNVGAIVATFAFVAGDKPFYTRGYATLMTGLCITAASAVVYLVVCYRENVAARQKSAQNRDGRVTKVNVL